MKKSLSPHAFEIIKRMQQSELTESYIYEEIAKFAKGEENKNRNKTANGSSIIKAIALMEIYTVWAKEHHHNTGKDTYKQSCKNLKYPRISKTFKNRIAEYHFAYKWCHTGCKQRNIHL